MPIAEVNGQRLYYEVHGEGEPLLAVMGLGGDHGAWLLQVPVWSQKHRLVVFDNRDVGQSSQAEGPYEVSDMAADALGLADELGLDSFHLVGLSLGGAIAQEVALAAPERVRTLTLAVTYGATGGYGDQRSRVLANLVRKLDREEFADLVMMLVHSERVFDHPQFVDAVRKAILENPHPQPPEAWIRQLEASGRHDALDRLGSLTMPVHVIGARRDVMVPPFRSEDLHAAIPGSEFTLIDAGHLANVEAAEEFNGAVLDFIAACAQPDRG
ncbi:MAG TPA: alpha/beta hydrolase [Thermoleophilaceae bacterium]